MKQLGKKEFMIMAISFLLGILATILYQKWKKEGFSEYVSPKQESKVPKKKRVAFRF